MSDPAAITSSAPPQATSQVPHARRIVPHLGVVIGLVAATMFALATTIQTAFTDLAGVTRTLPVQVGAWSGGDILYCHNQEVHGVLSKAIEGDVSTLTHCDHPGCGAELFTKDYGEQVGLPASTDIYKKRYRQTDQPPVTATVVLSGDDRASFHRPKLCIGSQGFRIDAKQLIEVELPGREPLHVKVYDLALPLEGQPDRTSYFAFWYVGKDRETASHYERMFWMGFDRLVRNESVRWAYVSVAGARDPEQPEAHLDELRAFLRAFYPMIRLEGDAVPPTD